MGIEVKSHEQIGRDHMGMKAHGQMEGWWEKKITLLQICFVLNLYLDCFQFQYHYNPYC